MGWRVRTGPEESAFSPVASEERDALLSATPAPPEAEAPDPGTEEDFPANTGTQRLLTALGRFERQVARAREGVPQMAWSNECMNQLIEAVEIAVAEGWGDVVEALTETARILQSYEDEGQAHLAVPFLADSYDVLCLMVGDLIVGKVRSGVMQKWRNRYRQALDELKEAGIPLVRDEEERGGRGNASNVRPFEPPAPAARPQVRESQRPAGILRSMYAVPEVPLEEDEPFEPLMQDAEDAEEDAFAATEDEASFDADRQAGFKAEAEEEDEADPGQSGDVDELPRMILDELPPLTPLRMDLFDEPANGSSAAAADAEAEAEAADSPRSPEVIERLDTLCESLSQMERDPEADRVAGFCTVLDCVSILESQAERANRSGCVELCKVMERLCDNAEAQPGALDDKFFELAYAFCGVYVEADDGTENAMIRSWIGECETLLGTWRDRSAEAAAEDEAAEVAPEPEAVVDEAAASPSAIEEPAGAADTFEVEAVVEEPDMEVEEATAVEAAEEEAAAPEESIALAVVVETPESASVPEEAAESAGAAEAESGEAVAAILGASPDSPEALLSIAQQAMSQGRAADAKCMALRAAAMLAQVEVEEASRRVAEAEERLRQGSDLIEQARLDVLGAEQSVNDAAKAAADGEQTLDTRQAQVVAVQQQVEGIEGRVAELDEQIRQLQAKRDEEARRLAETRTQLDGARSEQAKAEAELAARRAAEEEARVRLEDMRQRVKTLQRRRTEVEAAMERAREQLTRQRQSLVEIEQTLAQVGGRGEDTVEEEGGEFLF
jgi:hypothetical protein